MLDVLLTKVAEAVRDEKELDKSKFSTGAAIKQLSAGIEDSLEDLPEVQKAVTSIESVLKELAESDKDFGAGTEFNELGYAQIHSASLIAPFVADPKEAINKLYGNGRISAGLEDAEAEMVSQKYGLDDKIDVGMEYFDMQNISTSLVFNIVYNAFAPKQDEFAELFFPLVAIDPMKAGVRISARLINIYKEFVHTVDGTPGLKKIQEQPLIKAITDTSLLTTDKVKLTPVVRNENQSLFFTTVKWTEEYMGTTVTTAPIAFGKRVSLVGLAQTDEMLAKGGADFTDGLNSAIRLKRVYFTLTGKDKDGNQVTEVFKLDLGQRNSWFNETIQGTNKQMVLNFDEDKFFFLTPDTKAVDSNGNEIDSKLMEALPANLKINVRLTVTAQANTALGDVAAYLNAITVEEVTTKEGVKVDPSSSDYTAVTDLFSTVQPGGYVIEAYAYLGNAKRKGIHVLTRKQSVVVTVPYRSGFTQVLPVVVTGDDGDPTDLIGMIHGTRMKLNAYAVKTMSDFINDMRANPEQPIQGLSQYFVNNYFREENLDLAAVVDTTRSSERIEDIRAGLVNKIRQIVTDMILNSNYKIARDTLGYTGPIDVLIGMDLGLKLQIFGDTKQEMVGDLRFNYAGTPFDEMKDRIVISLGVRNGNVNKQIDPLNFGVCLWSPELVINTKKTIGEGVRTEVSTFPRFLHYINLPILAVLNVTNTESISGKNVYLTHTV